MFGFGKSNDRQNMQVPYEVYETVHNPAGRRWIVRLLAALIVVTLLVFGGIALSRSLSDNGKSAEQAGQPNSNSGQSQNQDSDNRSPAPTPPPQNDQAVEGGGDPATPESSSDSNKGTVRKPE